MFKFLHKNKIFTMFLVLIFVVAMFSATVVFTVLAAANTQYDGCEDWFLYKNCEDGVIIMGKTAAMKQLVVPQTLGDKKVVGLGEGAFSGCTDIASVQIGENITTISKQAFAGCTNLQSVTLPEKEMCVEEKAFFQCEKLDFFDMKNITVLHESAFEGCKALVTANPNCKEIPKRAFADCTSLNLFVDKACREISVEAFKNCTNLVSVGEFDGLKQVGDSAFFNCSNLERIAFTSALVKIGDYAFSHAGLNSVYIPKTVVSMGKKVFDGGTIIVYVQDGVSMAGWDDDWSTGCSSVYYNLF